MSWFEDKVVVVTGAGSGIGKALALAYGKRGSKVHVVDVDAVRVESVAENVQSEGGRVSAHVVDCSSLEEVQALAESVYREDSRTDVLHNNAGILVAGPVEEIVFDDWNRIVDVNIWGVVNGVSAFVPMMKDQVGGAVIANTSSMAGLYGFPFTAPYCMTKFAIVGLSEALNIELDRYGIKVMAVCPSAVRTDVLKRGVLKLPGAWGERFTKLMDQYAPRPERIAEQVLEAVKRGDPLWVGAGGKPLWWLNRLSHKAYAALFKQVVRRVLD